MYVYDINTIITSRTVITDITIVTDFTLITRIEGNYHGYKYYQ